MRDKVKHKNVRIQLSRFYVCNKGGNMMECLGCRLAGGEEKYIKYMKMTM